MFDQSTTIENFLNAAAAKNPTPGGGSVAALVGALGASMGEMVVNYSIGKKNLIQFDAQHQACLVEFHRARLLMLQLMVEDQAAFDAITAVKKLPADSLERKEKWDPTVLACIRVPQAIAATGLAILEICDRMADISNRWLLSDLAVCADLAMSTVRAGVNNVKVNLADVASPADRAAIQAATDKLLTHAIVVIQRTYPRIWSHINPGT